MAANYAVGVDFGGTKLLAAVVDVETGKIAGSAKRKSNPADGPHELMERLYSGIDEAIESASLAKRKRAFAGIGVGLAGQIDTSNGILLDAPNLSQATVNLPIAAMLADRYGVPVALLNDVQIAALGEARFGAGVDCDDFLCVFVGTGIGGAIVHNGHLVTGSSGSAGEIGHLIIHANGRHCGCGGRGHLEAYASRTAMTRSIQAEIRRGHPTGLTRLARDLANGEVLRSGLLAKAMNENDPLVSEVLDQAGNDLGLGLASAINLLNPARIILGGGLIEAIGQLFDTAARRAIREALPAPARHVQIVRAKLGDHSGVVGAALVGAQAAAL